MFAKYISRRYRHLSYIEHLIKVLKSHVILNGI